MKKQDFFYAPLFGLAFLGFCVLFYAFELIMSYILITIVLLTALYTFEKNVFFFAKILDPLMIAFLAGICIFFHKGEPYAKTTLITAIGTGIILTCMAVLAYKSMELIHPETPNGKRIGFYCAWATIITVIGAAAIILI